MPDVVEVSVSGLCLTIETESWDARQIPEQISAQAALARIFDVACRRSGVAEAGPYGLYSGAGVLMALLAGRTPAAAIPSLIKELDAALAAENRLLTGASRIRLRMALTTGLVMPGPVGVAGQSVAMCFRLVGAQAVREALRRAPEADLAVIVSGSVYQDVIVRGFLGVGAEECRPVRVGQGLVSTAWLHVPNRLDMVAGPPYEPFPAPDRRAEALRARAERRIRLGDHRRAAEDLGEALRLLPDPDAPEAEAALLRLGDCHRSLGELDAAAQTWLHLVGRRPFSAEAYLRLGRLEHHRGRTDRAEVYLGEGLRVVRAHPGLSAAPGGLACALLVEQSEIAGRRGDGAEADRRLNEAAEADPRSPLPLASLAWQAARAGDRRAARRLLDAALAQVPERDRAGFLGEQSESASGLQGGDVIMDVLLENDLYPAVSNRKTNAPRLLSE